MWPFAVIEGYSPFAMFHEGVAAEGGAGRLEPSHSEGQSSMRMTLSGIQ